VKDTVDYKENLEEKELPLLPNEEVSQRFTNDK